MAAAQGKTIEQMQTIIEQNRNLLDRINAQLTRPQEPPVVNITENQPAAYDFAITRDTRGLIQTVRAVPIKG